MHRLWLRTALTLSLLLLVTQMAHATCGDWLQHEPAGSSAGAVPMSGNGHSVAIDVLAGNRISSDQLPGSAVWGWPEAAREPSPPWGQANQPTPGRCRGPHCGQSPLRPQATPVTVSLMELDPAACLLAGVLTLFPLGQRPFQEIPDARRAAGFPLTLFRPPAV